ALDDVFASASPADPGHRVLGIGDCPPATLPDRDDEADVAVGMQEGVAGMGIERPVLEYDVGDAPASLALVALEAQARLFAHPAMDAVGPEDAADPDDRPAVGADEFDQYPVTGLSQADQFGLALHLDAEPGEHVGHDDFGLVLRQAEQEGETVAQLPEVERGDLAVGMMEADVGKASPAGEEAFGRARGFEQLE